jgi:hypothetical protein
MAQATGRAAMAPGDDHHVAFNNALDQALQDMDGKFEPGTHTVDVHQQLEIDVHSPGVVGWVKVTLTTTTTT